MTITTIAFLPVLGLDTDEPSSPGLAFARIMQFDGHGNMRGAEAGYPGTGIARDTQLEWRPTDKSIDEWRQQYEADPRWVACSPEDTAYLASIYEDPKALRALPRDKAHPADA